MRPNLRKIALTAHIASSVGWFGAVASFEALAIAGLGTQDAFTMRAAYLAMEKLTWLAVVPFAFTSLITGLIMALGTKWGLFRHYWLIAKFLINIFSIALLLLHTRLIDTLARAAESAALPAADLHGQASDLAVKGGAALVALLVAMSLAIVKPRGMTAYGRRKLQASRPALRSANGKRAKGFVAGHSRDLRQLHHNQTALLLARPGYSRDALLKKTARQAVAL